MNPQTQQPSPEAVAIAKAIGYTENGGKPDLSALSAGKSGEMKSIFQFTPATWANDSQQVFGRGDVHLNNDTETYVATQMVDKWLKKGYNPSQIFSMWNAGIGEPDAYTGKFSNGESSSGVNKQGVAYNVQSYVDRANKYLAEFSQSSQGSDQVADAAPAATAPTGGTTSPTLATNTPTGPSQGLQGAPQVSQQQYQQAISNIINLVKKGQKPPAQPSGLLSQAAAAVPTAAPA